MISLRYIHWYSPYVYNSTDYDGFLYLLMANKSDLFIYDVNYQIYYRWGLFSNVLWKIFKDFTNRLTGFLKSTEPFLYLLLRIKTGFYYCFFLRAKGPHRWYDATFLQLFFDQISSKVNIWTILKSNNSFWRSFLTVISALGAVLRYAEADEKTSIGGSHCIRFHIFVTN